VNYYVHVKGDFWLKTHKHYAAESVQNVLATYTLENHHKAQRIFAERRAAERATWRGAKNHLCGIEEMKL
jgi:hypothetical protein